MLLPQLLQNCGQLFSQDHCRSTSNSESPTLRACEFRDLVECSVVFAQDVPGPSQKLFACLSQNNVTRCTHKYFCPNFSLQLTYLHTDRSLRYMHSQGPGCKRS